MKKLLCVASLVAVGQFGCGGAPSDETVFLDYSPGSELGKITQAYSGIYYLQNINSGRCLDLSGLSATALRSNAQLYDCEVDNSTSDQRWRFDNDGFLSNLQSHRCLDVQGASGTDNGDNVMLWDCERNSSATDQRWHLDANGFLVSQASGKCLDVQGAPGTENRTNVQLWQCEYDAPKTDQRWRLVRNHQLYAKEFDLDRQLVGHWPLANSYSNAGTSDAATRPVGPNGTSYAPGPFMKSQGAMQFDGESYLAVDFDQNFSPTQALTFGARIYRDDWSKNVSVYQSLVSKDHGGGYSLSLLGHELRAIVYIAQTQSYEFLRYNVANLHGWNQVTATFNGSKFSMWLNGERVKSRTLYNPKSSIGYSYSNELIIGSEAGSGTGTEWGYPKFDGRIADVRIYDRELSSGELTVLGAGIASWNLGSPFVYDGLARKNGPLVANTQFLGNNFPSPLAKVACFFNQDRNHINIPFTEHLAPSAISVATWAYREDWGVNSVSSYDSLVSKTQGGGYSIDHSGDWLRVQVRRENAPNLLEKIDATQLTPGWHHLAFTYDETVLKFYVDGVLEKTSNSLNTAPIHYTHQNDLILGGEASSGSGHEANHFFRGSLGSVQVFDRALSETSIANIMSHNEKIQFVGDGRVYNRHVLARALAVQGMSLVSSKTINENECTLGYARSSAGGDKKSFGALVCATKVNGTTTITSKLVVGECENSGAGGQCEVGLAQNEVEINLGGNTTSKFEVNGPSAEACGSITPNALCAKAGANVAETAVTLEDDEGNAVGASASVGIGGGFSPSLKDGVLSLEVGVALGIGFSLKLSVNFSSLSHPPPQEIAENMFFETAAGTLGLVAPGVNDLVISFWEDEKEEFVDEIGDFFSW